MSDADKLFLVDCVHLGINEAELLKSLPTDAEWKEKKPNPIEAQGLGAAEVKVVVFGIPAELAFKFANDRLYAFTYSLTTNAVVSESLYAYIVQAYSARYGPPMEERDREPDHESNSSYWTKDQLSVVITRNEYADYSLLSWGFQSTPSPQNMRNEKP